MIVNYNGTDYEVVVTRKDNRNSYIRVKGDGKIYLTTSYKMSDRAIRKLLEQNYNSIVRMIKQMEKKKTMQDGFFYLGKRYDIIWSDQEFYMGEEKVFLPRGINLDNWYKKMASMIFREHLEEQYQAFSEEIPKPRLCIRKMTSRWGVCNVKEKKVTLNLELIKRDLIYLDYVIVHELSHLIYPNHSEDFWKLVEKNCPNYKQLRKEMKDF